MCCWFDFFVNSESPNIINVVEKKIFILCMKKYDEALSYTQFENILKYQQRSLFTKISIHIKSREERGELKIDGMRMKFLNTISFILTFPIFLFFHLKRYSKCNTKSKLKKNFLFELYFMLKRGKKWMSESYRKHSFLIRLYPQRFIHSHSWKEEKKHTKFAGNSNIFTLFSSCMRGELLCENLWDDEWANFSGDEFFNFLCSLFYGKHSFTLYTKNTQRTNNIEGGKI